MPRNRVKFFPVFVIALLALISAPAVSAVAAARAATSQTVVAFPICDGFSVDHQDQRNPTPKGHDHCPLCAFMHFGAAPPPQAVSLASWSGATIAADWTTRAEPRARGATRALAQARAPPQRA